VKVRAEVVLAYWSEQRQQIRQSEDQRAVLTNYVLHQRRGSPPVRCRSARPRTSTGRTFTRAATRLACSSHHRSELAPDRGASSPAACSTTICGCRTASGCQFTTVYARSGSTNADSQVGSLGSAPGDLEKSKTWDGLRQCRNCEAKERAEPRDVWFVPG
jgi:hypothetical protein